MWMAWPNAWPAASCTDSLSVGCAWIVASISSYVASSVIARPSSAIISVASEPMMCAPRISPCGSPMISFTKPSVSPIGARFAAGPEGEFADS